MPKLEPLRHAPRPADVLGVVIGRQPVDGAVGNLERLIVGLEAEERRHGTEGLFRSNAHFPGHAGQHCWRDELAAKRMRRAAHGRDRAMRARVLHVTQHFLHRRAVDERTDRDLFVHALADHEAGDALREARRKLVINRVLHENPVGRHARLSRVPELAGHHALQRLLQIRIVEDDERRVAAKFEAQPLQRVRGLLHQVAADARRAGERQLPDDLARRHRLANRTRLTRHDVDDTGRESDALGKNGEGQRGERRQLGRLDDDACSRRQYEGGAHFCA